MSYRVETKFKETAIGLVPEDWKVLKISDICNISSSKRIFLREYVKSGIPFYRSKEIILKARDQEIKDPLFITQNKYNEIKVKFSVPQEGEILLTSVGTLGIAYLIKNNDKFYFKDGNLTWFKDFKGLINSEFLYYWLKSNVAQKQIDTIAIGSTQKALTIDSLKDMNIGLMSINEQNKISKFFSDLDKKIEINNRINLILERIAQLLFKHWFIDFEFPNEQGKPYKSSGGEFIDSELGKIPKGWKIKEYASIADIFSGKGLSKDKTASDGLYPIYGANGIIGYTNDYLFHEELIITGRVGTLGKIFLVNEKVWVSDNVLISKPRDKIFTYFIYCALRKFNLPNLNRGSTQPLITKTDMSKLKIVIPTREVFINFDKIIRNTQRLIDLLNKQNQTLTQIRDTLLPKLITGKIRVNLNDIRES